MKIVGNELFGTLREKCGPSFHNFVKEKIQPLAGYIIEENFGLESSKISELSEEIDIIVNGAATTNFYERYDVALASNALGTKYICKFAEKCPNLKMFLHVSTAYVAGEQQGLLLEKPFRFGETLKQGCHLDIDGELKLVDSVKAELAHSSGNSKQLERTTMKKLGLKRTIDAIITAYAKQSITYFIGDGDVILDLIPGDMVVNAMMVAMAIHWNKKGQVVIHVSSSLHNPLSISSAVEMAYNYLSANPQIGKNGRNFKAKRLHLIKRFSIFKAYMFVKYKLPIEVS
ncbi:hypothetical protein PR202_gb00405 [Eleusine coracana subsp. coracana]|uniref:Fatty acyl-CoA reductase n=1 Tax=Eleusine coracana subsp. coracana TaxID=191504 RepID=A0AAV5DUR9_ELECO|nr:hypothetical protein PR202_gb00405 [Eleusine coracana subsp. coracana]